MISAHVHSVIEYGIDLWAIQSDYKLKMLQSKINRFLLQFQYPKIIKRSKFRKNRKRNVKICMYEDLLKEYDCITVIERRDYVSLKHILQDEHMKTIQECKESGSVDKLFEPLKKKILPLFKSELYKCSLAYRSIKLFNSLPRDFSLGINYTKEYMKNYVCKERGSDVITF